jgi:menaquinone reductase, multiheme cytochrome c subunit
MQSAGPNQRFVFPRWTNYLLGGLVLAVVGGAVYVPMVVGYIASPQTRDVGYQPVQPVPYSHAVHVGQLGMDCRYCHNTVEKTAFASLPPTQTCMNCHAAIKPDSPRLLAVRESYATGKPIEWAKVHDLPDYAYFDHSAHVNKGVSCLECHGRVDRMETVYQAQPLSMGWCLDCHRSPEKRLRPVEFVTKLDWVPTEAPAEMGKRLMREYNIRSSAELTNCSTCHR